MSRLEASRESDHHVMIFFGYNGRKPYADRIISTILTTICYYKEGGSLL